MKSKALSSCPRGILAFLLIPLAAAAARVEKPEKQPSVAVLPFVCASRSNDLAWAGKALPDLITVRLVAENRLNVLDRDFIQSVLAEQDLAANGFTAPDSLVVGKLRLADFLVLGELAAGPQEDTLTLRIVQSAAGTIEKTATIKGKLPKALDSMVESAAAAVAETPSGARPLTAKTDFRLARVPEAIESFYRALEWCAQGRPLRAAPHFAEAYERDRQFVLAKIREHQCYAQGSLPRFAEAVDLQLKKDYPALALSNTATSMAGPAVLVSAAGSPDLGPATHQEIRAAFEQELTEAGVRVVGREALVARTAELDLTLGGAFDPRHLPAYRAIAEATHVACITVTRQGEDLALSACLMDALTAAPVSQRRRKTSSDSVASAAREMARNLCADLRTAGGPTGGQATVTNRPAPPHESLDLQDPMAQQWKGMTQVDQAGIVLEKLAQQPPDDSFLSWLLFNGTFNWDWHGKETVETAMDIVRPDTYDRARLLYLLASHWARGGTPTRDIAWRYSVELHRTIATNYQRTPLVVGCLFRLGYACLQGGQPQEALTYFQSAEDEFDAGLKGHWLAPGIEEAGPGFRGSIAWYKGRCLEQLGRGAEAMQICRTKLADLCTTKAAKWRPLAFNWDSTLNSGGYNYADHIPYSLEILLAVSAENKDPALRELFVRGVEAYAAAEWGPALEALSEFCRRCEVPAITFAVAVRPMTGLPAYSEEQRRVLAAAFLKAAPAAVAQAGDYPNSLIYNGIPVAVWLLRRGAGGSNEVLRPQLLALEQALVARWPKEYTTWQIMARAYTSAGCCPEALRALDQLRKNAPDHEWVLTEYWSAVKAAGRALREAQGEDAEMKFLLRWADWKDPVSAQPLHACAMFADHAAGRLQAAGRLTEAMALYAKLARAYEKGPLPADNWKGWDRNRDEVIMGLRSNALLHSGECAEKLGHIDEAVALYKRAAKVADGERLQATRGELTGADRAPYASGGPTLQYVDQVAIHRLETLRARLENVKIQPG